MSGHSESAKILIKCQKSQNDNNRGDCNRANM